MTVRQCSRCKQPKPLTCFGKHRRGPGGYHSNCRDCNADMKLQRLYGITLDQYNEMLAAQGGVCYICRGQEPCSAVRRLAVDHNHESGENRKLLCYSCNTKLAWYEQYQATIQQYVEGSSIDTLPATQRLTTQPL